MKKASMSGSMTPCRSTVCPNPFDVKQPGSSRGDTGEPDVLSVIIHCLRGVVLMLSHVNQATLVAGGVNMKVFVQNRSWSSESE